MRKGGKQVAFRPELWPMQVLCAAHDSEGVRWPLRLLARLIGEKTTILGMHLTRHDWRYVYEVYAPLVGSGRMVLVASASTLRADLVDAQEQDDLAAKVWKVDPKGNYKLLMKVLGNCDDLDAYAILLAVKHATQVKPLNLDREEWWTIAHRTRATVRERVAETP